MADINISLVIEGDTINFTYDKGQWSAGTVSKEMAQLLTHYVILWISAHVIIKNNVEDPQICNGPGGIVENI